MAATPDRIALDTEGQAMTHQELAAHARAAHAQIPTVVPTGLRAEHAELLSNALGRMRSSLNTLAQRNENGVQACQDFGTTETNNAQSVSDLNRDIPKPI